MAHPEEPHEEWDDVVHEKLKESGDAAYEKMKEVSLWMVKNAWKRDDPHEDIMDEERWT